jgi:3-methylcrotonyl-CoA carboxylase alpha subunit
VQLRQAGAAADDLLHFDCYGYNGEYLLNDGNREIRIDSATLRGCNLSFQLDERVCELMLFAAGDTIEAADLTGRISLQYVSPLFTDSEALYTGDQLLAPMPGHLISLNAEPGQAVNEGDVLVLMEAMKMELSLRAPRAGRVASVRFEAGAFVEADTALIEFEPLENQSE